MASSAARVFDQAPMRPVEQLSAAVSDYARDALHVTGTPGLAIAIGHAGRVVWEGAFGFADLRSELPATCATTWRCGSFAKTYVATAVMQLIERGRLELYAPAVRYLADLPLRNPLGEREITIYDLLTHRSGLGLDTTDARLAAEVPALAEHIRQVLGERHRPEYQIGLPRWTAKVGERYQYSSFGMSLLGLIVEQVVDECASFAEYVSQQITQPLGLSATGFPGSESNAGPPEELAARLSTGYARFGHVLIPTPSLCAADAPAASIITTPRDQVVLLMTFLAGGQLNGHRLLGAETVHMMTTPQVEIDHVSEPGSWNGVGFEMMGTGTPAFNFGHGAAQPWGWYSHCAAYPQGDLAIAVCSNRWDMTRFFNPASQIAPGLLCDFAWRWWQGIASARRRARSRQSWAWRASYAMAVLLFERTHGLLGVPGQFVSSQVEDLIAGACCLGADSTDVWDPDGFRAGLEAITSVSMCPIGIRAFLDRGDGAVTRDDLPLLGLWFGKSADLKIPLDAFATE